jgi:hypothetical protein
MAKHKISEYVAKIDETSERCRECNEKLDLIVKDQKPEFNIVVFHQTCYTDWMKNVKEYGIRVGRKLEKHGSTFMEKDE